MIKHTQTIRWQQQIANNLQIQNFFCASKLFRCKPKITGLNEITLDEIGHKRFKQKTLKL